MRALVPFIALSLAACVQYPDGRFSCNVDSDCPGTLRCASDSRCHVDPSSVDGAGIDAATADAASTDTGATDSGATDSGATDAGSTDGGAMDAGTGYDIATLVDPSAPGHPANGTSVTLTGSLVALSPRLLVGSSQRNRRCNFGVWVGDPRGGPHSGIELFESIRVDESVDASAADAGPLDCLGVPDGVIPSTIVIGQTVTGISGSYAIFCPALATCPSDVAQDINVSAGTLTAGAMGATPASMTVALTDIAGDATASATDYDYQGALVRVTGVFMHQAPSAANYHTMLVGTSASGGPTLPVVVDDFASASCLETALQGMSAGASLGNVTGLLAYSTFAPGQWTIQLRQASDISGLTGC